MKQTAATALWACAMIAGFAVVALGLVVLQLSQIRFHRSQKCCA